MMITHYEYDELYGALIHKNEDNSERTYFIIECLTHSFYRWMFKEGWNKISEKKCERNGLIGFEVVLKKDKNNPIN